MAARTSLGIALQTRIFTILTFNSALQTLLGSTGQILDHVPDNDNYPLIVIGDSAPEDWSTHTFDGFRGAIQLRIWAQSENKTGKKEIFSIMDRVWALLHDVDLALPGRQQITFRCSQQTIILEDDNRTYQGLMDFNYMYGGNDT